MSSACPSLSSCVEVAPEGAERLLVVLDLQRKQHLRVGDEAPLHRVLMSHVQILRQQRNQNAWYRREEQRRHAVSQ